MSSVNTPQSMLNDLIEKFNNGDVEGFLAHYEAEAVLVEAPGKTIQGIHALRNSFARFFSMKAQLTLVKTETIVSGEIGCNYAEWKITGTQPDGKPLSRNGIAIDVIRRQPNGDWKIIIDNALGPAILR